MTPIQFRQSRQTLGLSRAEMADRLGIGLRTLERFEVEGCGVAMGMAVEYLLLTAQAAFVDRRGL